MMFTVGVGDTLWFRWLGCCDTELGVLALVFLYLASDADSDWLVLASSSDNVKPALIWPLGEAVCGSLSTVKSTGCFCWACFFRLTTGTSSLSTPGSPRLPNFPPFVLPIFLNFVSVESTAFPVIGKGFLKRSALRRRYLFCGKSVYRPKQYAWFR